MIQPGTLRDRPWRSGPVQTRVAFAFLLVSLVPVLLSTAVLAEPSRGKAGTASKAPPSANQIVALTNRERTQRGLPALKIDRNCVLAITGHVDDMAKGGFLSHEGRDGRGANERYRKYNPSSRGAGENLAYNTTGTGESFMRQWLGSSGHRNNILSGNYRGIGVAVRANCSRGDGKCYYYAGQCFSL
jgi:uncharacterized protein YkwD